MMLVSVLRVMAAWSETGTVVVVLPRVDFMAR